MDHLSKTQIREALQRMVGVVSTKYQSLNKAIAVKPGKA
jgi:hypothetical protein